MIKFPKALFLTCIASYNIYLLSLESKHVREGAWENQQTSLPCCSCQDFLEDWRNGRRGRVVRLFSTLMAVLRLWACRSLVTQGSALRWDQDSSSAIGFSATDTKTQLPPLVLVVSRFSFPWEKARLEFIAVSLLTRAQCTWLKNNHCQSLTIILL